VEEALAAAGDDVPLAETVLVVVGRGASDPDANSNVSKVTRFMWEGLGLGWAETAYSGVTFPLVEPGLEHVTRLGYRRVVVFPYFLFTGVLVKRIYEHTDIVAARHPEIEFIKAQYLNDHPLVLDCFAERVNEIMTGTNQMNCQLCKYRDQVLGFEDQVGLPQESHHHHVEGIGTDADSGHDHGHEHDHDHDHHHDHDHDDDHGHHPYPHAEHPLGPRSMEKLKADG
jgi:sirohydrochlorin cobaltochelatase